MQNARARPIRWRSPPEKRSPSSATGVSYSLRQRGILVNRPTIARLNNLFICCIELCNAQVVLDGIVIQMRILRHITLKISPGLRGVKSAPKGVQKSQ